MASYQYIPDDAEVAGLDDLDDYGSWQDVPELGHSWCPRVSSDWAPYRDGSWYDDQPLGLTWVSNEPWGWAPYHYGRWTNVNQRWFWVPGEIVSRPVYAPALVAFVPFDREDRVGWVPLGPGDPYVPRYYDRSYQPQYIGSATYITKNVNVTRIVNYNVPGAVTVVRTTEFTRGVTPRSALVADQELLGRSRPVLDPYADSRLRELAPSFRSQGPRVRLSDNSNRARNRAVITSREPIMPAAVAAEAPKGLKVRSVSREDRERKLQINNSGETVTAIHPNGLPESSGERARQNQRTEQERKARIDTLTEQLNSGDKSGKRERRQLLDEQRAQEKVDRRAARQVTDTQNQQQKQELKAARKAVQQQPPVDQQQKRELKAARKAAQQQPPVDQQQKKELKATRKAAQQQPPVQQQERKEMKAARKAAQQQPPVQQQQRQEVKAARKAAQQQPPVQPRASKAEREAEKARKKNENPN